MFAKLFRVTKKYFVVLYFFAVFLTIFHHHNDLKAHDNCQICVLQSNTINADIPPQQNYVQDVVIVFNEIPLYRIAYNYKFFHLFYSRGPPYIS